jgi:hypothetical protein
MPNTEALGLFGTSPQVLRRDITVAIGRKADVARIPYFSSDDPERSSAAVLGNEVDIDQHLMMSLAAVVSITDIMWRRANE